MCEQVLAQVFHPNVINLLGFFVPPDGRSPEYLVYEYAGVGTLAERVSNDENRRSMTWSIRLTAAVGVASGLNYLHHGLPDQTVFHHDVKPEVSECSRLHEHEIKCHLPPFASELHTYLQNIVFSETLDRVILIDCGISKVLKESQAASFKKTMAGTPFYLPDDYTEDTPYDEKCEVFSFGMVLRVLLSGKMPVSRFSLFQ